MIRYRGCVSALLIHALLDHAVAQDAKLHEVMTQLNKLGADVDSDAEVGKAFDVDAFKKL